MARILVIRGGAIGDFILTLPAIRLLKTELPDAYLEILGYESIASLAVEFGLADATRSIERGPMAGFFVPNSALDPELKDYIASFNLVVSYLFDPDRYFVTNLERAGARTVLQGSHRMDETSELSAAAQLAKPLEQLALYLERPQVSFQIEVEPKPRIALHPGSGSTRKNWGYENWARVARQLAEAHPDLSLLIVSGEAETSTIEDFLNLLRQADVPFVDLHSRPLPELARELAACRLFLGHDSGISHLAAACGVPCLLVFGPTNPNIWAPQNPNVQVIQSPGGELARLSPSTVLQSAEAILAD